MGKGNDAEARKGSVGQKKRTTGNMLHGASHPRAGLGWE